MNVAAFLFGLFAMASACVAFVPGLNMMNYCITLPLSILGLVLSVVALTQAQPRGARWPAGFGLALSLMALMAAGIRIVISLLTGGGIL